MRWHEFEQLESRLAELGRSRLGEPGVVLVGTIRADGTPRLSPVEPLFWRGELWLSMGWNTRKVLDLKRDSRVLVHSIVTSRDGTSGEYKVRGCAIPETTDETVADFAEAVAAQVGWQPEPGRFHLFRVDVEDVTFIRWDDATNDQYVSRWPAHIEFVRRGTSPTSLSRPEEIHELLG